MNDLHIDPDKRYATKGSVLIEYRELKRRVANPTFKPYQLLVGNWNPNLDEWEDIREATVDEVIAALGVTTEDA